MSAAADPGRTTALTNLALLALAGHSLLCRLALKHTAIDAAGFSFADVNLSAATGALLLFGVVQTTAGRQRADGRPGALGHARPAAGTGIGCR